MSLSKNVLSKFFFVKFAYLVNILNDFNLQRDCESFRRHVFLRNAGILCTQPPLSLPGIYVFWHSVYTTAALSIRNLCILAFCVHNPGPLPHSIGDKYILVFCVHNPPPSFYQDKYILAFCVHNPPHSSREILWVVCGLSEYLEWSKVIDTTVAILTCPEKREFFYLLIFMIIVRKLIYEWGLCLDIGKHWLIDWLLIRDVDSQNI